MKRVKDQYKYDDRMVKDGYTRATLWVPIRDKEELMSIAVEMRDEYKRDCRVARLGGEQMPLI